MSDLDAMLAAQAGQGGDALDAMLQKQASPVAPAPVSRGLIPDQNMGPLDKVLAKLPETLANNSLMTRLRGYTMGMADSQVGAAQLGANLIGQGDTINKAIADKDAAYQAERKATIGPDAGFDFSRLAGNITNPTNAVIAAKVAPAATMLGRLGQGAAVGGAGGAMAPVESEGNYFTKKGVQTAVGAVAGGILTPVVGAVLDKVGKIIAARTIGQNTAQQTDEILQQTLSEMGQKLSDLPKIQVDALKTQVNDALKKGTNLDPASVLRKLDYEAAGMQPRLGTVTRDPMQYAVEKNLSQIPNVGQPIANVIQNNNKALQAGIGQYGKNASEAFPAGEQLATALQSFDQSLKSNVSNLYSQARTSAGKDLDVPLQGLAQDFAKISHEFGDKVPSGVRNVLNDFGLGGGTQTKVFTVEAADKVLKVINANQSNDPATNAALGALRAAVKNAVTDVDAAGGVFAPAVKAAAERFKLHDAIPALEAAANGVHPDRFVDSFIINGKVADVQGLASVLQKASPAAFDQAKAQIGARLERAAFGENVAGDAAFRSAAYAKALREFGTDKLSAFFSKGEIDQLKLLSRVGAYENSVPAASVPNFSGTSGALANLLSKATSGAADMIPGGKAVVGALQSGRERFNNDRLVKAALGAEIPGNPSSPERAALLAKILAAQAAGTGAGLAPNF